jgi:hypothetical protein
MSYHMSYHGRLAREEWGGGQGEEGGRERRERHMDERELRKRNDDKGKGGEEARHERAGMVRATREAIASPGTQGRELHFKLSKRGAF